MNHVACRISPRGPEFTEPRLDIKDRRSVDCVEILNVQIESVDPEELAAGDSQPVQPAHVPVAEDSDLGPVLALVSPSSTPALPVPRGTAPVSNSATPESHRAGDTTDPRPLLNNAQYRPSR